VVVHLAFLVVGGTKEETRSINVEGTLNAFRAAAAAGAKRFVYASSVAAYGFHPDNPSSMTEQWPVRPAAKLFYAQEKAELELLLQEEASKHEHLALYLLRPPVVVGPHAVGGKGPALLQEHGLRRSPLPVPVLLPDLPLQVIHEDDVGSALLQCVLGAGAPGAYNIAADDVISTLDLARALGLWPLGLPRRASQRVARLVSKLPGLPSYAQWVEALSQPAIMDTTRARAELGWAPRWSAMDALADTVR
ncbi:MAG: NAD-dependent epimerase/dehydratase, partial [Frankiales bacterium]|nr:NAD-dependent epimerase/dehydratase [Frankiales bacterium]